MYTITRKLAMVCLAVVFSVVAYGCGGGGGSDPVAETPPAAESMPMPHQVNTEGLLTIIPGTYNIPAGEDSGDEAGDVTFTCPTGGPSCAVEVAVDNDGNTAATSVGGMATAMNSVVARLRIALEKLVDAEAATEAQMMLLTMVNSVVFEIKLADGYKGVESDVHNILAGEEATNGDVTFTCPGPADGPRCVVVVTVTVDDAGGDPMVAYTSLGGAATGANSDSVNETRAAIALTAADNGLKSPASVPEITATVTRDTENDGGETTIALAHGGEADPVEYTDEVVDPNHGWPGKTLKRVVGDNDLATPEEATVYTKIELATEMKLTYGGEDATGGRNVPPPTITNPIVLDQEDDDINMPEDTARMFTGTISGVYGTFKCANTTDVDCGEVMTMTNAITGQITLEAELANGWTFESRDFIKTVSAQDSDFMYFGYWLQSPADPSIDMPVYKFVTFFGSSADNNTFALTELANTNLMDTEGNAKPLKATYEGGAAGRYVTRTLEIDRNQAVDDKSSGYHGRFTANATLRANFGVHAASNAEVMSNTIDGEITNFMDMDVRDDGTIRGDLGFRVDLERTGITIGSGLIENGNIKATFDANKWNDPKAEGMVGGWNGQFYGPDAAEATAMIEAEEPDPIDASTHFPSGVAGEFNAHSNFTSVVGAFAAEKQ